MRKKRSEREKKIGSAIEKYISDSLFQFNAYIKIGFSFCTESIEIDRTESTIDKERSPGDVQAAILLTDQ